MTRRAVLPHERLHGRRLGQQIADSRLSQQKSAPQLAVLAEVSIDAIRSLESGRVPLPSFLTIAKLADVLGLSLDELHRGAQLQDEPVGPQVRS